MLLSKSQMKRFAIQTADLLPAEENLLRIGLSVSATAHRAALEQVITDQDTMDKVLLLVDTIMSDWLRGRHIMAAAQQTCPTCGEGRSDCRCDKDEGTNPQPIEPEVVQ